MESPENSDCEVCSSYECTCTHVIDYALYYKAYEPNPSRNTSFREVLSDNSEVFGLYYNVSLSYGVIHQKLQMFFGNF